MVPQCVVPDHPVVSRTGSRLAMHATGVGKVLLAYVRGRGRTR
jgi:DNA-binding IclR family transcriptional regulator